MSLPIEIEVKYHTPEGVIANWRKLTKDQLIDQLCIYHEGMAELQRDSLDAAWAEAEAALPEGWVLSSLSLNSARNHTKGQVWWVSCYRTVGGDPLPHERVAGTPPRWDDPRYRQIAYGPTPAAALRALAEKLRGGTG